MISRRFLAVALTLPLVGCQQDPAADDDSAGPDIVDQEETGSDFDDMSLGTNVTLNAMWGSGPSDLWLAGDGGALYHYTGSNWTATPSGTVSDLNAVWGTADGSVVYVVGDGGFVARWDAVAGAWVQQEFPFISNLTGIAGFGADDVWVSGFGGLFHWDGSSWSAASLPVNVPLRSLWGTSGQDLWLVGDEGVILHGGTSGWEQVQSGETRTLNVVRGSGSSVWIAGQGGLLLRWDGSGFARDANFADENNLWSLWVDVTQVFVAGANARVHRYDGAEWGELEAGDGVQVVLYALFGFGPSDLYAVGGNGTVLHYPRSASGGDGE